MDLNKVLFGISVVASIVSAGTTLASFVRGARGNDRDRYLRSVALRTLLVIACIAATIVFWPSSPPTSAPLTETADAHYQKAKQFFFEHNPTRAMEEAKRTISLEPSHVEAHKLLGDCYLNDNAGAAVSEYQEAVKANPEDMEAELLLAAALEENKEKSEAIKAYCMVLASSKSNDTQRKQATIRLVVLRH